MGFFKEFKDDLSQAVNELLPDDNLSEGDNNDDMVNTLDADDMNSVEKSDNDRINEWLEELAQEDMDTLKDTELKDEADLYDNMVDNLPDELVDNFEEDELTEEAEDNEYIEENKEENKEEEDDNMDDNVDLELLEALNAEQAEETEKEAAVQNNDMPKAKPAGSDDQVTVITKGTTITGSISSDGSLDVMGTITGDIECLGKLSITGKVKGNSTAAEVFVNTERLEGSINSEGSVKVGLGTVVIGDIIGTSGVIAGAVKGEIDIQGPIVVDSTAIIKGNIKAKSVQINNGAIIEGFCSLSYSDIDVDNIFE
ncbi:polymer-forming cytoskeletal protein [Lachnospiraceae bacterium MD1]|uniref:Polymer-forming cytoskeletal protein n=1 Tax=Variimorphobacter saccharofermentans TaxID=2755051 RepID=A0A839K1I6_9FIRM|nr:polymer-forming cytoskeletal protein [Variimorphobacter saccharofermentans]MBB2182819.1 polymer-forming cytoskeletal protein [Variimorphobacter saccharofermentans]